MYVHLILNHCVKTILRKINILNSHLIQRVFIVFLCTVFKKIHYTCMLKINVSFYREEPCKTWPIVNGKSLAGYVAHSRQTINTTEIYTVSL